MPALASPAVIVILAYNSYIAMGNIGYFSALGLWAGETFSLIRQFPSAVPD
jgi:hypothetical protein